MTDLNATLATTHAMVGLLEKVLNMRIHAEGVQHIPDDRPVLFVINHFTRMETFLIPRVIYQETGKIVRSLGDKGLFKGAFGTYLRACGVLPTNEPQRNRIILGDLMTGRSNWVIYPEGAMVKSKKVYENGEWVLDTPYQKTKRSPHTGSAVLALKACLHRLQYRNAQRRGDNIVTDMLQERFHFEQAADLGPHHPVIIPVNISYYPIRPGQNALSLAAKALVKGLPRNIEEELKVEGNMLLTTTDISVYFSEPIDLKPYVQPWYNISHRMLPFIKESKRINMLIGSQKNRLMKRFMKEIYENVSVNFDHIYGMGLRRCRKAQVSEVDFLCACYCAAMRIREFDHRRIHPSLREALIHIVTDRDYEPLNSIRQCAIDEGLIHVEDGIYHINRDLQRSEHEFHNIRLKHPIGVIANEIEPLTRVVEVIDNTVNQPAVFIRKKVAQMVMDLDEEEFKHDYEAYYDADLSKPPENGMPFYLKGERKDLGIVLSHGYLAAPPEVRELAHHLNAQGFPVYGVRLKGHGTAPHNLMHVSWEEWLISYLRGLAVIKNTCKKTIVMGFSMGGLLAMLAAARSPKDVAGVVTINSPMKLRDAKSKFVPALAWWNRLMENFDSMRMDYVENESENPQTNYSRNYINGVNELDKLIDVAEEHLPKICVPSLIVQANQDPVVDPESAEIIQEKMASDDATIAMLKYNNHIIIRGERSQQVFTRIDDFINHRLTKRIEKSSSI